MYYRKSVNNTNKCEFNQKSVNKNSKLFNKNGILLSIEIETLFLFCLIVTIAP